MIDINQLTTVGGLAVLILVLLQLFKGVLETKLIPFLAVALGIVLMVVFAKVLGNMNSASDLVSYALGGLFAGLSAIGGYETLIDKLKTKE